ncbi:MAG: MerR family transcriptional regulator, partial [[Clostridium] symbiosum]
MKELFTIGEMAKLFGVNIRTLRYYDEIGILCPETTDPDSGYRYYSTRQFERMNSIKYLRALDMPLKSIALFFEQRDVRSLQFLMEEQKLETRRQ